MLTLWDLAKPRLKSRAKRRAVVRPTRVRPARASGPKAQLYERLTREMLDAHGVRVRKWRSSMSGVAWVVTYHDGSVSRLIEAPRPKGPMSAAIFLHEIGHHAIGFGRFRPRCLEEYHAWRWSLDEMARQGVTITRSVQRRMQESLHYAVVKARRRGLKRLPDELLPFASPPPKRSATGR